MAGETYAVLVESRAVDAFDLDDRAMARKLALAINKTARQARPAAARAMREQVNFRPRYLSGATGRLQNTSFASETDLKAVITGRGRPTSLAHFARNARRAGQVGARVEVNPGAARFLPRAFFIKLRSGNEGALNNLGLAIRLPEGVRPSRAYKPKLLGPNLWLLYGPSIDQVFDDVAAEQAPGNAEFLEREFLRLLDLDLN